MERRILMIIQDVTPDEMMFLVGLMKGLKDEEVDQFLFLYKGKRRTTQEILLMTLIGFLGIAGIQRFMLKQTGMGIIYLLTFGFCYIGTIVDLVNHKNLTDSYNQQVAMESVQLMNIYKSRPL
ncbi:TM2 domain-containing protein [Olivibacter sp. SDN3]|uniref:TM2 domain-containing protein n=1 Tax=Olivibacter sp. SDN3 TaxID=2764720 RepID=UPI0016515154|nr:TM2 domain-containing protein [Olivibacter sp. SDN3]QNL51129.1 TM2 domain-containing protein [Olivibacter sp. SDN3]